MENSANIIPFENTSINVNLSEIPDSLLLSLLVERNVTSVQQLKEKIEKTTEEQRRINKEIVNEINTVKNNLNNQSLKLFTIQSRINSQEYLTRTNLGAINNPPISRIRMTKLLKYAGIFYKNESRPYIQHTSGKTPLVQAYKIAKPDGSEYMDFKFHCEKTWSMIYKKMHEDGIFNDFQACISKEKIDSFIDRLVPDDEKRN